MGGGLMQLVAYGAQDVYLTGNPQITFFKVVYRRHTNFSKECIEQTFSGAVDSGKRVSATLARNGDLVQEVYLRCKGASANDNTNMIKWVECEVGGQKIDKQYSQWLDIYNTLFETNHDYRLKMSSVNNGINYIPLRFWFNRNPGLALPLIALQYHEVKINMELGTIHSDNDATLLVNYLYLDTDERRRFAQVSHEYLIEQLQFQSESGSKSTFTLNFNHPVKEIIWTGVHAAIANNSQGVAPRMETSTMDPKLNINWHLKLNGHDRTSLRHSTYFTRQQVYDYHTGYGGVQNSDSIAVYSFALKPEEHQPSGTCNFSRIDTAQLVTDGSTTGGIHIYAVNYNVLRIMSGMGGLAYSN